MMTSSNGNIFRVIDPLCCVGSPPVTGGFLSQKPVTWNFDFHSAYDIVEFIFSTLILVFLSLIQRNSFLIVQYGKNSIYLVNCLAFNRQQTINWTNGGLVYWRKYGSWNLSWFKTQMKKKTPTDNYLCSYADDRNFRMSHFDPFNCKSTVLYIIECSAFTGKCHQY